MNEVTYKKVVFPTTTKQFLGVIGISAILFASIYAYNSPSSFEICNQSYVKATNAIESYNKENPNYKTALPIYNCNINGVLEPKKVTKSKFDIEALHKQICNKQINSPLCKDFNLLDRLYQLTEERLPGKNMFPILVGITNAESSLGLDFANDKVGGKCDGRNNWGGTKYQIHDDNTRTYKRSLNGFEYENSVDQYGCNLYPFKSIEEFWITKVNGMRYGYKSCIESETPIKCISFAYVGKPNVSEKSWVANVAEFIQ